MILLANLKRRFPRVGREGGRRAAANSGATCTIDRQCLCPCFKEVKDLKTSMTDWLYSPNLARKQTHKQIWQPDCLSVTLQVFYSFYFFESRIQALSVAAAPQVSFFVLHLPLPLPPTSFPSSNSSSHAPEIGFVAAAAPLHQPLIPPSLLGISISFPPSAPVRRVMTERNQSRFG